MCLIFRVHKVMENFENFKMVVFRARTFEEISNIWKSWKCLINNFSHHYKKFVCENSLFWVQLLFFMQNRKWKLWKNHRNSLFKRCENWILWYAYHSPFQLSHCLWFSRCGYSSWKIQKVLWESWGFSTWHQSCGGHGPFWAPLTECLVLKKRELFGQAVGQT